jgi:ferric-dicitrate binding protein FerR (iron transport regulator)
VSARTEAAFSALIRLDPAGGVPGAEQAASRAHPADPMGNDTEACIARIITTPRSGAMTEPPARRAPQWTGTATAHRRRARYGAIGLVASAAVAVITTLLWASPSAGAPRDQAITVPAHAVQTHSPQPT